MSIKCYFTFNYYTFVYNFSIIIVMKYFIIGLFKTYQMIPGKFHSYCKHIPSCSEYGIIAVQRFGSIKGIYLTIKRILKCNPWTKKTIDLVPERKIK